MQRSEKRRGKTRAEAVTIGSRTEEGSPGDFRGISGKVMLGEPKGGQVDA